MSSDNYLFHGNDLGSVLHAHHQKMIDEINATRLFAQCFN